MNNIKPTVKFKEKKNSEIVLFARRELKAVPIDSMSNNCNIKKSNTEDSSEIYLIRERTDNYSKMLNVPTNENGMVLASGLRSCIYKNSDNEYIKIKGVATDIYVKPPLQTGICGYGNEIVDEVARTSKNI